MRIFYTCIVFALFCSHPLQAQHVKKLEKILFTVNPKHSVYLETNVRGQEDVRMKITLDDSTAELNINDLSHSVVKNLMELQLGKWVTEFDGKRIYEIFADADVAKIDDLVTATIITRTAYKAGPVTAMNAVYRFLDTVPLYMEQKLQPGEKCPDALPQSQPHKALDSAIANHPLMPRLLSLQDAQTKLSKAHKDSAANLSDLQYAHDRMQIEDSANESGLEGYRERIGITTRKMQQIGRLMALNSREIAKLQVQIQGEAPPPAPKLLLDTICKKKYRNVQIGRLYIDTLTITKKSGFLRTIGLKYNDSMDIATPDGWKRISRKGFGFADDQKNTLVIDMRSVTFSEDLPRHANFYVPNSKQKDTFLFNLGDMLKYYPPKEKELMETFVPRNGRFRFWKDSAVIEVPEMDVDKIVTLNLFSDLIGVQEDKPNGLLQAEAKFFGSLQRDRYGVKFRYYQFVAFNYFEINYTLSKIENKLKYIELLPNNAPGDTFRYVHTFNLMQYQNMEFGGRLNLLKYADDIHEGHLTASIAAIRTGVRDSLIQESNGKDVIVPRTQNLWSTKYGIKALYRLKAISRVGMDLSVALTGITLLSSDVKQSGGYYNDLELGKNKFEEHKFPKNLIATFQAQGYYYASKDESQRLYLRFALNKDVGVRGNRFVAFQVGYSADINKFLQFK